ncbi:hypothetical protein [Nitrosopumilus sp.]|uniref:hypothetical protein n=1 Tax=Nitrosopumilus sp. TaxID=2024843 RepID=UPI00349FDF95
MSIKRCLQCSSEDLDESDRLHVLMEQGYVIAGTRQNGIEVVPTICKKCGFVMLFRKGM